MFCFTSKPTQHFATLIYKCKLVGVALFSCGTVVVIIFKISISGDGRSAMNLCTVLQHAWRFMVYKITIYNEIHTNVIVPGVLFV